ncbi:flavin reductase (DIM6/NTAB) family NADH-FMN oxidoreductase RutF [Paraburkholderia youngii]|uniref:flavin reductase family protein n=1 Tax=Paraburkholderia youngii TaxID=2782701 RepID=UPI003D1F55BF
MSLTVAPESGVTLPFTSREFRNAMGQFATGVVVVTANTEGEVHAMTANSFMSGSLEPPLVLVSIAKSAKMHERITKAQSFGISILAQDQEWCSNHFAGKTHPVLVPIFAQLEHVPIVEGANVQVATVLRHAYECGDHTLFVGEVTALVQDQGPAPPLVFHAGKYAAIAGAN